MLIVILYLITNTQNPWTPSLYVATTVEQISYCFNKHKYLIYS